MTEPGCCSVPCAAFHFIFRKGLLGIHCVGRPGACNRRVTFSPGPAMGQLAAVPVTWFCRFSQCVMIQRAQLPISLLAWPACSFQGMSCRQLPALLIGHCSSAVQNAERAAGRCGFYSVCDDNAQLSTLIRERQAQMVLLRGHAQH